MQLFTLFPFISQLQSYALGQVPGGRIKDILQRTVQVTKSSLGFIFLGSFVLFAPALLHNYVQDYILQGIVEDKFLEISTTAGFLMVLHSAVT